MATSGNPPRSRQSLCNSSDRRRAPARAGVRRRRQAQTRLKWHEALGLRRLQFEPLEQRALLSMTALQFNYVVYDPTTQSPVIGSAVTPPSTVSPGSGVAQGGEDGSSSAGPVSATNWAGAGQIAPFASASPVGLVPVQIRGAYGINSITLGSVVGTGAGQTIAIIDAYDDPNLVSSTSAAYATSDLHMFDAQFGLTDFGGSGPVFTKLNENGGTTYPTASGSTGWSVEESLDVEWAHAMAPMANIDLIEASSTSDSDLMSTAVNTARNLAGVSAITMSFGRSEESTDPSLNSLFTTPSGHAGVTFLASTGDSGSPGEFPAYSPNVVAVGGTTLTINGNSYVSEVGWSDSGGGQSSYESEPTFQNGVQTSGYRQIPDVSFDADPNSGVAIYDSYDYGSATPWIQVGGTSVASPCWAGLVAIGDQLRTSAGLTTMDGPTQALPLLYGMKAADFHDITSGSNGGFTAHVGYDEVTGIGTPVANNLVPAFVPVSVTGSVAFSLSGYEIGSSATITVGDLDISGNPSCSVTLTSSAGDSETLSLAAQGGGMFSGSIPTSAASVVSGDGILETVPGGTITATFNLAVDGKGITGTVTAQATTYTVGHYTFSTISSPQTAGVPFAVTATAYDTFNNPIPSYAGTVPLTATGQAGALSVSPTTVTFSSGTWTGNVTVNAVDPTVQLRLNNGNGANSTSNLFATQAGPVASFQWSTIPSPESENVAFPVTLTAKDANGYTATPYNGSAALSGNVGSGGVIESFDQGSSDLTNYTYYGETAPASPRRLRSPWTLRPAARRRDGMDVPDRFRDARPARRSDLGLGAIDDQRRRSCRLRLRTKRHRHLRRGFGREHRPVADPGGSRS